MMTPPRARATADIKSVLSTFASSYSLSSPFARIFKLVAPVLVFLNMSKLAQPARGAPPSPRLRPRISHHVFLVKLQDLHFVLEYIFIFSLFSRAHFSRLGAARRRAGKIRVFSRPPSMSIYPRKGLHSLYHGVNVVPWSRHKTSFRYFPEYSILCAGP